MILTLLILPLNHKSQIQIFQLKTLELLKIVQSSSVSMIALIQYNTQNNSENSQQITLNASNLMDCLENISKISKKTTRIAMKLDVQEPVLLERVSFLQETQEKNALFLEVKNLAKDNFITTINIFKIKLIF